jgi:hypothetical protein
MRARGIERGSSELVEESQVVLEEQADVGYIVFMHH